jgi:hypothetical protein
MEHAGRSSVGKTSSSHESDLIDFFSGAIDESNHSILNPCQHHLSSFRINQESFFSSDELEDLDPTVGRNTTDPINTASRLSTILPQIYERPKVVHDIRNRYFVQSYINDDDEPCSGLLPFANSPARGKRTRPLRFLARNIPLTEPLSKSFRRTRRQASAPSSGPLRTSEDTPFARAVRPARAQRSAHATTPCTIGRPRFAKGSRLGRIAPSPPATAPPGAGGGRGAAPEAAQHGRAAEDEAKRRSFPFFLQASSPSGTDSDEGRRRAVRPGPGPPGARRT